MLQIITPKCIKNIPSHKDIPSRHENTLGKYKTLIIFYLQSKSYHFPVSVNLLMPKCVVTVVEVVKACLDFTGKYPNTNKGRKGFLNECN